MGFLSHFVKIQALFSGFFSLCLLFPEFFKARHHTINDGLGFGWTAGHIDIYWNHFIDATDHIIGFSENAAIGATPLLVGFIAAFITGALACKAMIRIVKRGKLIYFALYCMMIGFAALAYGLFF